MYTTLICEQNKCQNPLLSFDRHYTLSIYLCEHIDVKMLSENVIDVDELGKYISAGQFKCLVVIPLARQGISRAFQYVS